MLQLSIALLRLAVASSMASYLVRDEYCGTPLTEGVDLMGEPTVASAGAALAVDAAGAVALTSEKFARYVEYVLESAGGFASCDGAVGCGGTRCAVRRFRGSPAAGATLAAAGAVRYAWSTSYGAVAVGVGGGAEACDAAPAAALEWTLRAPPRQSSCRGGGGASRGDGGRAARAGAGRVVHGLCEAGDAAPAVARLMVERAYAPGRDDEIYAAPARAPRPPSGPDGEWAADQFRAAGVANVAVVPEAVDPDAMSPDAARADAAAAAPRPRLGRARVRVLSVFKLERRKGWDVLLDGWWDAFDGTDDVELVVHAYKPSWIPGDGVDEAVAKRRARHPCSGSPGGCARVAWLGEVSLDRREMRALYAAADAFCLPTRGEGWGLPVHEAMAMALPVVATNFSGVAALAAATDAWLLPPGELRGGYAQPTARDVARALRDVAGDRAAAADVGRRGRRRVASLFSPEAVARAIVAAIEDV
ncbi:glycosyl transferase [Aureococcus anophagefferens]|uniref:Glycosyl transferase n=1 Tax=Aureococcus anophagefferens TaxID=44056 RepID=A0ABR1FYL7_AURAN